MTPGISLMPHQKKAVAHILYGNNTRGPHGVGAGKTFQMIAAGMESAGWAYRRKTLCGAKPPHRTVGRRLLTTLS